MTWSPDPNTVIPPTVAGTINGLEAAAKESSVRRFVLTSSASAATLPKPNQEFTTDVNSWNDEAVEAAYAPPPYEKSRGLIVYAASKTEGEKAAWKFIQFLTRPDVNGKVVDLIPANVKAADSFLRANRKGPDRILAQLNNAAPRPLSPRYLEVSDIEVTLAQDVYGGMDAKQAAEKACKAIDALK